MQTINNPRGRRCDLHVAQNTRREAATELLRLDIDVGELCNALGRRLLHLDRREAQLFSRQRRNLTCNANHTEAVRTVRRQFELEHDIIKPQCRCGRNPDGRILRQNVDAMHLFLGQSLGVDRKLPCRAHHAIRGNAAQLALRDLLPVGQNGADHCNGNDMPLTHIGCARHNLSQLLFAEVQLTHKQMIGVRMRRDLLDASSDNLLEPLVRAHDALYGNARHREAIRDLLRRSVNIHIVFQPFDGNLHSLASLELM